MWKYRCFVEIIQQKMQFETITMNDILKTLCNYVTLLMFSTKLVHLIIQLSSEFGFFSLLSSQNAGSVKRFVKICGFSIVFIDSTTNWIQSFFDYRGQ